ncbi:hypothetical protein HK103_003647 [Boothiomyces macroporosus]|uniref:Uncharacterized protein n=1 Tax=Boothiomyces macroporosus TaxID=261099 RepID=A0AAD5Y8X4_9FUNG|nr:hypothetical protein HK103_003647 [Boothiomyces macroporosus]
MSIKPVKNSKNPKGNPLLVKGVVGKTRPTVFDLPDESHVYGKPVIRNPSESAVPGKARSNVVLQHWNVKAMSKQTVPALDYITMNRNTASKGIITPKEIRKYRKDNPVRLKEGEHSMYRSDVDPNGINCVYTRAKAKLPSDSNPQFTYGKPTRPSTPVAKLMTDHYQKEWGKTVEEENKLKEQAAKERKNKKKSSKHHATHHKVAPKQKFVWEKDPKELFKMTKFRKIPATVVSHREEKHESPTPIPNFVELNIKTANGKQFEFEAVDAAQKEDYPKALELLDSAISMHSTYASAFNNRAQVYRILGEEDKALQDIEVAIKYGGPATLKQVRLD